MCKGLGKKCKKKKAWNTDLGKISLVRSPGEHHHSKLYNSVIVKDTIGAVCKRRATEDIIIMYEKGTKIICTGADKTNTNYKRCGKT